VSAPDARGVGAGAGAPALLALDLGGVLIARAAPVLLAPLLALPGADPARVREAFLRARPGLWTGATPPAAAWASLAAAAGAPGAPCPWRDDAPPAGLVPLPALGRVAGWAARTRVAVLSNHRSAWVAPLLREASVLPLLSPLLVSDRIGAMKPDAAAYAGLLATGIPAGRVLFVDDQPVNLEAAAALGMGTLLADPGGAWADRVDALLAAAPVRGGR
jgi:putative hydrolase of the HAD superfamily